MRQGTSLLAAGCVENAFETSGLSWLVFHIARGTARHLRAHRSEIGTREPDAFACDVEASRDDRQGTASGTELS